MMNTETEKLYSKIEKEFETKGIKFELPIDEIDGDFYDCLLEAMQNYISKFTDNEPKYIGHWKITIEAKDIEF